MPNDDYTVDTPIVRHFIQRVHEALEQAAPAEALRTLEPDFATLLADQSWLPYEYRQPAEQSNMGGGIASWLVYRAAAGDLSLFALVVPAGSATPVHDHLAWGLVGLYQGEQDEEVFRRVPGMITDQQHAALEIIERNHLLPGDFYKLMPPEGDIHRVLTTSPEASVSIHLLGNDTGCVWRHTYYPEEQRVQDFRSGWTNAECLHEHSMKPQT